MGWVSILALLLMAGHLALSDDTYAVYIPKYIRPGTRNAIDVELLNYTGTINVEARMLSSNFNSTASGEISPEGKTATLVFDTIPLTYDGSTKFIVSVTGRNSVGEEVFSNFTTDIIYSRKFVSIFIQTDKAIYQPGHTIKFRAIVTTSELLPYEGSVTYKLQDPAGNIILKQSDVQLIHGVAGDEFQLGRYSTLGDWKIIYDVFGFEESITVSVEEYKLPKFRVDIKTDQSFLHAESERLTGQISATYTFGQPVRGSAVIEIKMDSYWWHRPRKERKILLQFPQFDGSESFEVAAATIQKELQWVPSRSYLPLKIKCEVTDKNTGDKFEDTATVSLHELKIKVEALAKPEYIKPGLPYSAYLKISLQDGTLLSSEELENLHAEMDVLYSFPYDYKSRSRQINQSVISLAIRPDGIIAFKTVAIPGDFENLRLKMKIPVYGSQNFFSSWITRFKSPSSSYLQVSTDDTTLTVGDIANLTVYTTQKSDSYRIMLLSRGKVAMSTIHKPEVYDDQESFSKFSYRFTVEMEHSPSVYAVVSFVKDDGEFIADTVKINVQATLNNQVTMTAFPNQTDAGMPVSITVQADAGSFVGLRAVDQSVLLLKSGNDMTEEKIFEDLEKYGPDADERRRNDFPMWRRWFWWPWSVGGADVSEVFENSGIIVLSDGLVYRSRRRGLYFCDRCLAMSGARTLSLGPPVISPVRDSASRKGGKKRSYFPESWIWTENVIGDDGTVTLNYNVPDTITTWELSSFAVSDTKGLGVTKENSKITVFRNFFISLDLPPSVVRGEVLRMKAVVFNYFDEEITATVSLTDNDWYDIIMSEKKGSPGVREISIPSKDSVTVIFPIKLTKAGEAPIVINAQSARAGDQVERTLRVKPEGIPKVVSHSNIMDRRDKNEPATVITFDVDIPPDAVDGSVYVKFLMSGNILGNALSNLGNLLKMPSGCGEQTMVNLAPDVYISLYLKKVGRLTGGIKQKSERHIRGGYQNELRYQRRDGSFSAFGERDRSGSTWLTAFVAKVFRSANELNPDLIEEAKIEQALRFILRQQNRDGTFKEPGRVLSKTLQGGINSQERTTAYILIALTEGGVTKKDEEVQAAIKRTQRYLERKVLELDDLYTLSIIGYALSLAESVEAGSLLNRIDSLATVEGNVKYWQRHESGAARCLERGNYCPYDSGKPSSSIEMTAYVLLTYVKQGRINEAMPIVRWLIQERGASGGYRSTQDTVMAIQALSTVAGYFSERPIDLDINVVHGGQRDFNASFVLSDENAIILQMADLPKVGGKVAVIGTGEGFADVQVTVGYNLPVEPRSDEPFVVDIKVRRTNHVVVSEFCSRINEDRKEVVDGTGMYIISFTLPSGYTIDEKSASKKNPKMKMIELEGEEVTGYFDELPRGRTVCMTLELIKYTEVEGVKPKLVTASDYYKPERSVMRMLSLPPEEDCPCCNSDVDFFCCVCPSGCGPKTFPCPNFVDGLFYDPSSHIYHLLIANPDESSCTAPEGAGESRSFSGLPASQLNGVDQYIECSRTPFIERMMKSKQGWTFSIAVYPLELTEFKTYTIVRISSESASKAHVLLAKRPRSKRFWLRILLNDMQMVVRAFNITHIPVNRWSLLTARLNGDKANVFVNGGQVGVLARKRVKTDDVERPVALEVGRSPARRKASRANFKGLVAGLNLWVKPLTNKQVMAHYNHWKSAMTDANPTLTRQMIHHIVPESIHKCFSETYRSTELKSRAGDLSTDCDDSV